MPMPDAANFRAAAPLVQTDPDAKGGEDFAIRLTSRLDPTATDFVR
jgi:hypothetical protein